MSFDLGVVQQYAPLIVSSASATIILFLGSIAIGTVGGVTIALTRRSRMVPLSMASASFTWVFRGLPPLVVLFITYYALPEFGLDLSPLAAGIVGLGLVGMAYNGEIFRAGIGAVDKGQHEAAQALAMTRRRYMWRIIAPQAFRVSIPPYFSNATTMLKATSLASVITVTEVMGTANRLISNTFRPLEILAVVAVIYLLLNTVVVALQAVFERLFALRD